jgi:ABC-type multidrug transport system fused ATPase/permease subunit
MSQEAVVKTINLIIAPVVMLTTCGMMLNGLMGRYSWLSDRVRSVHQERLSLLELELSPQQFQHEQLHSLDRLLQDLLQHHHQLHDVLVLIYLSILVFMLDMLVIALAIASNMAWLHQWVIVVFLIGIGILLASMVMIAHELRTSHDSIQLELYQSCNSCKKPSRSRK